jgi:1-acyl-sn-glycerol-3-phosphate acyltransferase
MIIKYFSKVVLWLFGWKVDIRIPEEKKYVIAIAPHTSNWDLLIGKLANWSTGHQPKFIIKKEAFNFFTAPILKMWGGIPIDRNNTITVVDQLVNHFEENEYFVLGITPEATRKRNPNWKTGFYRIAVKAKVPIYLGYVDFKTKEGGMHQRFDPTGNMEEDIKKIKAYFKDMEGYHKDRFTIE